MCAYPSGGLLHVFAEATDISQPLPRATALDAPTLATRHFERISRHRDATQRREKGWELWEDMICRRRADGYAAAEIFMRSRRAQWEHSVQREQALQAAKARARANAIERAESGERWEREMAGSHQR